MRGGRRLLIALGSLWLTSSVWAVTARVEGRTLVVNELPVLTLRTGPSSRLHTLVKVLAKHDGSPNAIGVKKGRRMAQVKVGGAVVFLVEPRDAQANQSSALGLAQSWASSINKALALPAIKLSATSARFPVGGQSRVWLTGAQAAGATVASGDPNIVKVSRGTGQLNLVGVNPGSTTIQISSKAGTQAIEVKVLAIAAAFPQNVSATATGLPATPSTVHGAIEHALWTQLRTSSGVEIKFDPPKAESIPVGEARSYAVKVKVSGPEVATAEGIVNVLVRNQPTIVEPEAELWYCNHPENLTQYEQLFGARLRKSAPARLLFHHINETPRGMVFHAQAINESDKPARILIIPGDAPTDKNPVFAGIQAADVFFRNWLHSSGEIMTIPPGETLPISIRRLAPKDTVSGLLYMAILDGPDSILVRADAKPTFFVDPKWTAAMADDTPWRVLGTYRVAEGDLESPKLSEHIYPVPFKSIDVNYQVGGRHGFVRIGQTPIQRADGKALDGNFGVVYTINAKVENPTELASDLELVFEASAGYSGALFALNGEVYRTPLLQPKDERRILKMRLEPGQTRQFTLQTIPLSGSSYPITLAIRPIDAAFGTRTKGLDDKHDR